MKIEESFKDLKDPLGWERVTSQHREQMEEMVAVVLMASAIGLGEAVRDWMNGGAGEEGRRRGKKGWRLGLGWEELAVVFGALGTAKAEDLVGRCGNEAAGEGGWERASTGWFMAMSNLGSRGQYVRTNDILGSRRRLEAYEHGLKVHPTRRRTGVRGQLRSSEPNGGGEGSDGEKDESIVQCFDSVRVILAYTARQSCCSSGLQQGRATRQK